MNGTLAYVPLPVDDREITAVLSNTGPVDVGSRQRKTKVMFSARIPRTLKARTKRTAVSLDVPIEECVERALIDWLQDHER